MQSKHTKIFLAIILLHFFLPVLTRAAGYDFFVDKNSVEAVEDGTEARPFKTIGAAMNYIKDNDLKKKNVFIKNGTYQENITLCRDANLIGENRDSTIIDGGGQSVAVLFDGTNSDVRNITVKNANNNFIVDRKSKAHIENCDIKEAGVAGVEIKRSSARKAYQFTLRNSAIAGSNQYGAYISRRKIEMTGNYIHENKEEGIDVHDGVKGKIIGNQIEDNDESGIETILAGTDLTIKDNDIKNNDKQGIGVQAYSSKKGKIRITKNTISGNGKYGIRLANYTHSIGPKKFKIFADKYIKLSKNTIKGNDEGNISYE